MKTKAIRILFAAVLAGSLLSTFLSAQNAAPPPPAKPAGKARPAPPTPPAPPPAAAPPAAAAAPPAPPAAAPAPVPPVQPAAAPVVPDEGPDWKTRVFKVRQADLNDIKRLLGVFRAHLLTDNDTGVLMAKASPQTLDAIAETLETLDVPPPLRPDVELTVYLVEATEKPATPAAEETDGLGEALAQVRNAFPYHGFRVLESMVLRGHTDELMRANGVVPYGAVRDEEQPLHLEYQFSCEPRVSSDLKGKVITLDKISLGVRIPVAVGRGGNPPRTVYQDRNSGFNTSVNLRENARVIVGKASMDGTRNALLLVVTGRWVE
ncbi:MAG: hypothetical protein KA419_02460 [Acidobacteria bacterium]|nr:hypothetical protein [Acidobacteriota bacterium]